MGFLNALDKPWRRQGCLGMRAAVILLGAALLTGCAAEDSSEPQTSAVTSAPTPVGEVERSEALLEELLAQEEPGCSVAIARGGQVVWAGARGLANQATGAALDTKSYFDLASVSKQFTAALILLLVEDRSLRLEDHLDDHLDGLPAWASQVRLEHLMHHTSGIPDYTTRLDADLHAPTDQQDALAALAKSDLEFKPGSRFAYSNSNYVLLAEVVAQATGEAFPAVAKKRLFDPLNLDITIDPLFTSEQLAQPEADAATRSAWTQVGDGSAFTTPSELARWGDLYRTGAIGGPDFLAAVTAGAVDAGDGSQYAAGLLLSPDGVLSHSGSWAGYLSAFGVSADREMVIAISCNAPDAPLGELGQGLQEIWLP